VLDLFKSNIDQRQITRLFSVGLLGEKANRRLVPTDGASRRWTTSSVKASWIRSSITRPSDKYLVFSAGALANNVVFLLTPTPWMFEGLEMWHISAPDWHCDSDFELYEGRKSYASTLAGAYYAARLPAVEYLEAAGRQAGAIAFLEVMNDWIPLGVWRFRELAREALAAPPQAFDTLDQALAGVGNRLKSPIKPWLDASRLYRYMKEQKGCSTSSEKIKLSASQ